MSYNLPVAAASAVVISRAYLGLTDMSYAFMHAPHLISVPSSSEGIEHVTKMNSMLAHDTSLDMLIGGWGTSSVVV